MILELKLCLLLDKNALYACSSVLMKGFAKNGIVSIAANLLCSTLAAI
jgi:hypothetical protein